MKEPHENRETIFLDDLNLFSFWRIITNPVHKVIALDAISGRNRILKYALKFFGIELVEIDLFAGNVRMASGESVPFEARRIASHLALTFAYKIIKNDDLINKFNQSHGRNTIELFIARRLQLYIEYWMARILVSQRLSESKQNVKLFIKKPYFFDKDWLDTTSFGVECNFYSTKTIFNFELLRKSVREKIKALLIRLIKNPIPEFNNYPLNNQGSILILEEESIRTDNSQRNQLYWHDFNKSNSKYVTFIFRPGLRKANHNDFSSLQKQLFEHNIYVLDNDMVVQAMQAHKDHVEISNLRKNRKKLKYSFFFSKNYLKNYYRFLVGNLFIEAENIGCLGLYLNTKLFLIKEPQLSFSDAIQIISGKIGIETICIQYSNMGSVSPLMMSTADDLIVFSKMYENIYKTKRIYPGNFIYGGYIYQGVKKEVHERANHIRNTLQSRGADFIICYFDESVQKHRWGVISKSDHHRELQILANLVLSDESYGVVCKSQFISNTPSRLYPEDEIINKAIATGRFIELKIGSHRNDIYPTEAALISDLCINQKFGSTAGLEAAVLGIRTILLNNFGVKGFYDDLFTTERIVYQNLESVLLDLKRYRKGDSEIKNIGDWSKIISHFDPYCDGKSVKRLSKIISERFC